MFGYWHLARVALVVVSLLIFVAALSFHSVGTCINGYGPHWFKNENVLFWGWTALLVGQIGWYANVPCAINAASIVRNKKPRPAYLVAQVVLLLIAIVTLLPSFGMELPHNEAWSEPVCRLGLGFWMWVCAQVSIASAAIWLRWEMRTEE